MAINVKRKAAMQKRSDTELAKFVKSGSLSAAAADFELRQRHGGRLPAHILSLIG